MKIAYPKEPAQLFTVPWCWIIEYGLYPIRVCRHTCYIYTVPQEFDFLSAEATLSGINSEAGFSVLTENGIKMSKVLFKSFRVDENTIDVKHNIL
jgi:hypothetical protein